MKQLLIAVTALLLGANVWAEGDHLLGTWRGTLPATELKLRLAFHIKIVEDGQLFAKMDIPDQEVIGIPVSQVTHKDSNWSFMINYINAKYEGIESVAGKIEGIWTWTQRGQSLPLTLFRENNTLSGALGMPFPETDIMLQFTKDEEGHFSAKFAGPQQRGKIISVRAVRVEKDSITVVVDDKSSFFGVFDEQVVKGEWKIEKFIMPLELRKETQKDESHARPGNP